MVCDEFLRETLPRFPEPNKPFTGNVAPIAADRPGYQKAQESLRGLGAKVSQRTIEHRPRYAGTFPEPDMTLTRRAAV